MEIKVYLTNLYWMLALFVIARIINLIDIPWSMVLLLPIGLFTLVEFIRVFWLINYRYKHLDP